jgi:hypothetical protein
MASRKKDGLHSAGDIDETRNILIKHQPRTRRSKYSAQTSFPYPLASHDNLPLPSFEFRILTTTPLAAPRPRPHEPSYEVIDTVAPPTTKIRSTTSVARSGIHPTRNTKFSPHQRQDSSFPLPYPSSLNVATLLSFRIGALNVTGKRPRWSAAKARPRHDPIMTSSSSSEPVIFTFSRMATSFRFETASLEANNVGILWAVSSV